MDWLIKRFFVLINLSSSGLGNLSCWIFIRLVVFLTKEFVSKFDCAIRGLDLRLFNEDEDGVDVMEAAAAALPSELAAVNPDDGGALTFANE